MRATARLHFRAGGVGSRCRAVGRAIRGFVEMGKDIKTHGDGTGGQIMTKDLSLKKATSPCAGGSQEDEAKVCLWFHIILGCKELEVFITDPLLAPVTCWPTDPAPG